VIDVSTDTWEITLPSDWVQKEPSEQGALYFESADGSKAMYISTWNVGANPSPPNEVAESFKAKDMRALHDMDGYKWSVVAEQVTHSECSAVVLLDNLAAANTYRIVTKILARPPLVIRASFHDYLCEDYELSRAYFTPIIDSLNLRE
jgi:hypothetical protein